MRVCLTRKSFILIFYLLILLVQLFNLQDCTNTYINNENNGDIIDNLISEEREIEWTPGINEGIPARTVIFTNVKGSPYNAIGDDNVDDTEAIQNAINDCPEGQVVFLPEGDYKLTNGLSIRKGIVIRGEGTDKTKLKFYREGYGSPNIQIGNMSLGTKKSLQTGYKKGATSIKIESVSELSIGDLVFITQNNDGNFITSDGSGGPCTWCGTDNGNSSLGQILLIKNISGNFISFEPPLYWNYSIELNPYIKKIQNPVINAGLEDIYIDNVNEAVTNSIQMNGCQNSWLKNIESYNGQRHIEMNYTYKSVVRDSFIHHHHNYIPNHYSLLLGTFSTANLVENNIFYHTKGGTIMCAWGAAGNVIAYNYCRTTLYTGTYGVEANITHHGAHPIMNLWESNKVQKIGADNYWGSISHSTFFRNYVTREEDPSATNYTRFCVILEANCTYFNFIGNIFGYEGMPGVYEVENEDFSFSQSAGVYRLGYNSNGDSDPEDNDPEVKTTLFRHGNFNYIDNEVIWDPDVSSHEFSDSYYLNQKPEFFGSLDWPAIGYDIEGYVKKIPAEIRFENLGLK